MSCDLAGLFSLDLGDPEEAQRLLDQCLNTAFDPTLWAWAIGLSVLGAIGGALIGRRTKAVGRDVMLGIALGPLGWVVSLLLPKAKPKAVCPACKRPVDAGDRHCRNCGAPLGRGGAGRM